MSRLWHWGWTAAGIGALALSLRLVHAFQMSASPLFIMPAVDAATYSEQAASLAAGNWLGRGQGPFWQPPLYPYFLGVIKLAFPESFYYVSRFAQALIGSLTCVLLYPIGQRLFGPGIGFIGGLIAAVYGPLIFWRGDEIERNQEMYYWRKYSNVLAGTLWKWGVAFPFGLVSPLALLGLLVYIRRQGIAPPVLFVLGYSFAVISFFVAARYRLPIVPLLILFAVYGGSWLYARWRQQSLRQALLPTVCLALLVLLVNWDLPAMDGRGKATTHNDLGNAYLQQGRYELALLKYEQATRLDSTYWQAWFNLGSLRAMRGDLRGALPILLNVLEHERERADVWSNVAGVYVGLGQYQQAVKVLEQAVVAAPREDIDAALERVYAMLGRPRGAK